MRATMVLFFIALFKLYIMIYSVDECKEKCVLDNGVIYIELNKEESRPPFRKQYR